MTDPRDPAKPPRLHVGITPWRHATSSSARALTAQAVLAEQLGYGSFWLPETHFSGAWSIPEPMMWLSAVAAATDRILLATSSYLLPLRHPVQAAEQVAVLDQLSEGRVILGVGRGFRAPTFSTFNVDAKHKRRHFEQSLAAMKRAWRGDPIGDGTEQKPVTIAPRPVQQPHPPIWAAGFGPKGIRLAARLGLPYLASPRETLADLSRNYAIYAEACTKNEREVPQTVPVMRTTFVAASRRERDEVRDLLRAQVEHMSRDSSIATRAAAEDVDTWALVGELEEVRDQVQVYVETLGMTHLVVTRLRLPVLPAATAEASVRRAVQLGQ